MAKNIIFQDKHYHIPTEWQDVTISQFQKILTLDAENISERISILSGIDLAKLKASPVSIGAAIANEMKFIFTDLPESTFTNKIEFRNETFELYPLELMSFGQFIDWDTVVTKGNIIDNLQMLIAIRTFKNGDGYNQQELNRRKKLFNDLPIVVAYNYATFFLSLPKHIEKLTEFCSMVEIAKVAAMEELRHSIKNTVGIPRLLVFQKIAYLKLIEWRVWLQQKYYYFFVLKKKR
jgi:hypothetical protein